MQTTVIIKGEKIKIVTQKYITRLYVAMYREENPIPKQMALKSKDEKGYHKNVRKQNEWVKEEPTNF